jgi:hypothetical protein
MEQWENKDEKKNTDFTASLEIDNQTNEKK